MKIKNALISVLTFILIILLCSCGKGEGEKEKITIPSATFPVSEEVIGVGVDEKTAYLLYTDKITTLDLESGIEADYCETEGGTLISAEGGKVCVYSAENESLTCYAGGFEEKSIACQLNGNIAARLELFGNTAVIASDSSIYYIDIEKETVKNLGDTYKGKDSFSQIRDIALSSEQTAAIISYISSSANSTKQKLYIYNLKTDKQIDSYVLDNSYGCFDYSSEEESIYALYNLKSIIKTDLETFEKTRLMGRSDYVFEEDIRPSSGLTFDLVGNSAVMWTSSDEIVVTRLIGENPPLKLFTYHQSDIWLYEDVIAEFEASCSTPVQVVYFATYDSDTTPEFYYDKLKTKLLAKDRDIDLYMINQAAATDAFLLQALLENNAYEPLENYENIIGGYDNMFDGVRNLMTYNDHIFGIPLSVTMNSTAVTDHADKLNVGTFRNARFSYGDIWNMCEKMEAFDESASLLGLHYYMPEIFYPIIQESVENKKTDRGALQDLCENIKKYYDAGDLYHEYKDGKAYWNDGEIIINDMGYINYIAFVSDRIDPFDEADTEIGLLPTINDVVYHNVDSAVMMNPSSQNKNRAADFLSILTNEKHLYNTDIFCGYPLGKDITRYPGYNDMTDIQKECLEVLGTLYENSKTLTFSVNAFDSMLSKEIYPGLLGGTMTGKEAADRIAEFIEYTYFE